jgi:tetratricopeptide (TPR) repeat protein
MNELNNNIENILSQFDFDKNSEHYSKINVLPKIEDIEPFLFIANLPDFHPSLVDPSIKKIILLINNELNLGDIKNSMLDTYFYTLGVRLFELSTSRKIDSKNIFSSKELFQWAIAINTKYYQAYNRLGDCYKIIENSQRIAISCFKNSLNYIGYGGLNDLSVFSGAGGNTFKGDNYLKIGLCLLEINRKNDAKLFILKAKEILNDDYFINGSNLNYSNWDEIWKFLDNYDSNDEANKNQKEEINQKTIGDEIQIAVGLKRNGNFDEANNIYIDLNNNFPNEPMIIKSWAKIFVCLQEYDKAIDKYEIASKLYKNIGNPEYYQCDDQANKIKSRFNDPDSFKSWVSAISGGSIDIQSVEL